jgi:flagellar basal-body rod protein FlgF
MVAQMHRMDALSNDIANVDTTGYKRDIAVEKAFPELLLHRMNDDGVRQLPFSEKPPHLGSFDVAPIVGKLGTGVEMNELYTDFQQGSLKQTDNPFDMALQGKGFFVVQTPYGNRLTRDGSFTLGPEGLIVTQNGYPVLGEKGPIHVKLNNFVVDEDGKIFINEKVQPDANRLVSQQENQWDQTQQLDRLRVVNVQFPRYLKKQGNDLYIDTQESGQASIVTGGNRPKVRQGFLEASNVNPVTAMVDMIEVNRAYEANQKVIQAEDDATGKLWNEVVRV